MQFFSILGTYIFVNTVNPDKRNTYNLKLVGRIGTFTSNKIDFQVKVFDSCSSNVLNPSSIADQIYILTYYPLLVIITEFTEVESCGPFTYTLDTSSVPSFIKISD